MRIFLGFFQLHNGDNDDDDDEDVDDDMLFENC